jgi:hypothetical protein
MIGSLRAGITALVVGLAGEKRPDECQQQRGRHDAQSRYLLYERLDTGIERRRSHFGAEGGAADFLLRLDDLSAPSATIPS